MAANRFFSLVLLNFIVIVLSSNANNNLENKVWEEREKEAKEEARHSYDPNPATALNDINGEVHRASKAVNRTRRDLREKYVGPCLATNPIDQCWRCQADWAENRMKLADCAMGFGRKTTGGKGGKYYVVTDPSDDDMVNPKPGTLRHAVIQKEPLWIIFKNDMVINLKQECMMTGDKTIDGRGSMVEIAGGAGLTLQFIKNVIIHNIKIHDAKAASGGTIRDSLDHFGTRGPSDGDGISMFGATNVWIDHISMSNCQDGLIDAIQASTAITISNCHFTNHNEALLFGASDASKEDEIMQITVAFTHFGQGMMQRMPRVRWGFVHIVNNDYTHWLKYAVGGSMHPTILSQGNRYSAPHENQSLYAKEVTHRDYAPESEWKNWIWRSVGDEFRNGAFFKESGDPKHVFPSGDEMIPPKPGLEVGQLTRFSGFLKCIPGQPC